MLLTLKNYLRRRSILKWKKSLATQHKTFDLLYQNVNGFTLSAAARNGNPDMTLVYGEIEFLSFAALLSLVKPMPGEKFYDLGSGTGKGVIAAALIYDFGECCGIELLAPLYQAACNIKCKLATKGKRITFIHGDFTQLDFSDAGVIFINATGFFAQDWDQVVDKLKHTKPGCRIIVSSKRLPSSDFTQTHKTRAEMSWGVNSVKVFQRQ